MKSITGNLWSLDFCVINGWIATQVGAFPTKGIPYFLMNLTAAYHIYSMVFNAHDEEMEQSKGSGIYS